MVIDFHTHVFPPLVAEQRDGHLQRDPTFRLLYEDSKAKVATADDLIESMDAGGIDASVALGFAWQDTDMCRLHNDYLIEASGASNGRIVAFCTLPFAADVDAIEAEMHRCAANGARGFGELRPDNLDFDLIGKPGRRLAQTAKDLDAILLFHVTEPVGHAYAGKEGLAIGAFYRFVAANPDVKVVGAHWAGGLPFYSSMPEVLAGFEANTYVDTAASSLLYDDGIFQRGAGLVGAERVLFGSDYPLLSQKRGRRRIEESGMDQADKALVLGDNAAELLGLT